MALRKYEGKCKVDGCKGDGHRNARNGRYYFHYGYCNAHYLRFVRHGHPTGGLKPHSAAGEPLRFLDNSLQMKTDECIEWPYAKSERGYGLVLYQGKHIGVHRLALLLTVGDPPSEMPYALHSCANPPCVNPNHLRWGTPADNAADTVKDGHSLRGEKHGLSKLTTEAVLKIRTDARPAEEIAKEYGVHKSNIHMIRRHATWAWLTDPE
jgi:hypothetical protein